MRGYCLVIVCALLSAGEIAGAAPDAISVGPGEGMLPQPKDTNTICPGSTLHFNANGTYEGAVTWQNSGVAPPHYGAFAECYTLPENSAVCAAVFDLTRTSGMSGGTMDVYVWADAGGAPGTVLSLTPAISPGEVAVWPSVSRHSIDIADVPHAGTVWIGYWSNWPGQTASWYVGADDNGPGTCTKTNIAPGIGFPSGWQDCGIVWNGLRAVGIGYESVAAVPFGWLEVDQSPAYIGQDGGHCCWRFRVRQNGAGPGPDIRKIVMQVNTPEVGIVPSVGSCPNTPGVDCTTQTVTWDFPNGINSMHWYSADVCFTRIQEVFNDSPNVTFTAVDQNGNLYPNGPISFDVQSNGAPQACYLGCYPPPPSMTAWYPLDEAGGPVSKDFIALKNATWVGSPVVTSGAYVGNSLRFPTSADYLNAPGGQGWINPGVGDFSIDFWFRSIDTNPNLRTFIDHRSLASNTGYTIYAYQNPPRIGCGLNDNGGPPGYTNFNSNVVSNLYDGQWHHIAVIVDRDSPTGGAFYVDALPVGSFDPTGRQGNLDNNGSFRIAQREVDYPCAALNGEMDEVEFFKRALSGPDIFGIYFAGAAGKCKTAACTQRAVMANPLLQDHTRTEVWMCTPGVSSTLYWSLLGLPASPPGCSIDGPTQISPAGGGPVYAAPCASSGVVTMNDPGVSQTVTACYRAKVVNPVTGDLAYCDGTMRRSPRLYVTPAPAYPGPRSGDRAAGDGAYIEVPFTGESQGAFMVVNRTAQPMDFPYRIRGAACSGDTVANRAIVLNHLEPPRILRRPDYVTPAGSAGVC